MRKQLLILSVLMLSMTVFGQKNEIKQAEKALKSSDFDAAITALNGAEGLIGSADQKTKAKFYYLKAKAVYKNGRSSKIEAVADAFNALINYEKESQKLKYTNEIQGFMNQMVQRVAKEGSAAYEVAKQSKAPEDYAAAASKFHQVYMLSPRDTTFLDNAAGLYTSGKSYEKAVALYEELLAINYTGISTVFTGVSKDDGSTKTYNTKKDRDLQVKLGLLKDPSKETSSDRRSSIYSNLSRNYAGLENTDKAMEVLKKGRIMFPDNYSMIIEEANLYFNLGDHNKFKELLELAIQKNPTDPILFYNVGIITRDQKNIDGAIENFKKAIELDPNYADAYNAIGNTILLKLDPVKEELNANASDFDKYDKILAEKYNPILRACLPYLEKAYELNMDDAIKGQLNSIYENLEIDKKIE